MLLIRKEQKQALDAFVREKYIETTVFQLKDMFPDTAGSEPDVIVADWVEVGIAEAEAYGIVTEREVTLYIELREGLGHDFKKKNENRWIVELLSNENLDPREKMELIYHRLEVQSAEQDHNDL